MDRVALGSELGTALVAAGRYAIFHTGRECGEERWRLETVPGGIVATGNRRSSDRIPTRAGRNGARR